MRGKQLVHYVGIMDMSGSLYVDGAIDPAYHVWGNMLRRCYAPAKTARQASYEGCSVHPSWHKLSVFKAWYDKHVIIGYHLDKDILIPGNKVYGPYTCCFVPPQINMILTARTRARGDLPLGVSRNCRGFRAAHCDTSQKGKRVSKTFRTVAEAKTWYCTGKARVIREVADSALTAKTISLRIHAGLLRHARLIENS